MQVFFENRGRIILSHMKKMNLKWRLTRLPTPDELRELVKDKIITQDEAREILFDKTTEEDRDAESLKSEIKFLRELVQSLSKGRSEIVTTIYRYEKVYNRYPWWTSYQVWCSPAGVSTHSAGLPQANYTIGTLSGNVASINAQLNSANDMAAFSSIKTF